MSFKEKIKGLFKDVDASKKEEVISAVKDAFNDIETSETVAKFIDATLADGTPIMIEPAIEVGGAVTFPVDGEIVPVEDASHELADGTVIVTVGGVIEEVITPEGEAVEEEEMSEEAPIAKAEMPSPKTVIERTEVERKFAEEKAELESKITALEEANKELSEKFSEAEKAHEAKIEELFNKVEQTLEVVLDFSAEAPTEKPKVSSSPLNKIKNVKSGLRAIRRS